MNWLKYEFLRKLLQWHAEKTGTPYSLPKVTESHFFELLDTAKRCNAVVMDYDDTIEPYLNQLSEESLELFKRLIDNQITVIIVSDRPYYQYPNGNDASIIKSFEPLELKYRRHLYFVADSGTVAFKISASGEVDVIDREPDLTVEDRIKIFECGAIVKTLLAEMGEELHDGSLNIEIEDLDVRGYALMLKPGTDYVVVQRAAERFSLELEKRGFSYKVIGKLAKNPANPPYIGFQRSNKSIRLRHLLDTLEFETDQIVIIGDGMFASEKSDRPSKSGAAILDKAVRLLVKPIGNNGHQGRDRDMERAIPGALTFCVGGTGDSSMINAYVTPEIGPEATRRILRALV
jgi:hypothetical protein